MKLSTGKIAFPIEFDNGDKDCIYFNPNDPDLATRLIAAKDKITVKMESMKFEDFELSNSGEAIEVENLDDFMNLSDEQAKLITGRAEKMSKIITDTKKIIFDELNAAFDSDVSSVVFKHCSPFAVVNGEYFIMQFLTAVTPEIRKNINKSNAEVEKKMAKHLDKYKK